MYGTLVLADLNNGFVLLYNGSGTERAQDIPSDGVFRPDHTEVTCDFMKEAVLCLNTTLEFKKLVLSILRL
jgi:hypothetical protein